MRRRIGTCLLAVLMLASLAVPSLAAGVGDPDVQSAYKGKCTVTFADKNKGTLEVRVTTPKTGAQYLVVVQNVKSTVPIGMTEEKDVLTYINQNNDGKFDGSDMKDHPTVYPAYDKYPSADGTYYLYIISDKDTAFSKFEPVATFKYQSSSFIRGDADMNGILTSNDALVVLQAVAKLITLDDTAKLAADADKNGILTSNDALYILQAVAKIITLD